MMCEQLDVLAALIGKSIETKKAYTCWHKRYFGAHGLDEVDLSRIDAAILDRVLRKPIVDEWLVNLHLSQPEFGHSYLKQAKDSIVFLARVAMEAGYIDENSYLSIRAITLPNAESGQNPGVWLTIDQLLILFNALATLTIWKADSQIRNTALITTIAYSGIRVGELVAMRWNDLKKQGDYYILHVHGKNEKPETVKLTEEVITALFRWKQAHPHYVVDGFVFVNSHHKSRYDKPLTPPSAWKIVQEAMQAAGLMPASPHDFRRTFSRVAHDGGSSYEMIRQALRHEHIEMSEHYINAQSHLEHTASDIMADYLNL